MWEKVKDGTKKNLNEPKVIIDKKAFMRKGVVDFILADGDIQISAARLEQVALRHQRLQLGGFLLQSL